MRKPGKRMASVIASIAAVCVMTGGIGYQAAVSGAQTDSTENSVKAQNTDQQESTDGSFSEEGTTQIGTVSQMPEFTVNAVTMTVEEVYASSGDTVSKGDALFKLTDESMEAAKSDYEDAISDAENTLKTAEANLASGKLSAESTKQDADLTAQTAADSYQAQVDAVQNKNMQFLTVVSTIFFPLTLITGWYGMNFQNMPELKHGYPGVILLSLIVVAVCIIFFKKKKIL